MNTNEKQNIKQGAVIGGWLCFVLGTAIMYYSLWTFMLYVPLFIASFVLSITAMAQRRIIGGILLLLTTLIVPSLQWFYFATTRGGEFLKTHLPPELLARYNVQKEAAKETTQQLIDPQSADSATHSSTRNNIPPEFTAPATLALEPSPAEPAVLDDDATGDVNEILVATVQKTWVTVRKDDPKSPPIFEDYLYPGIRPLKLRGTRFFIEARDPSAVQITKNGIPIRYQTPGVPVQ